MLKLPIRTLLYSNLLMLCHCVGPTTPFGAPVQKASPVEKKVEHEKDKFQVQFHPDRQVFHDKTDFSVEVNAKDSISADFHIKVLHNGYDVTESFLSQAYTHKDNDSKNRIYSIKNLRLKTLDENDVKIRLFDGPRFIGQYEYKKPDCSLFQKRGLASVGSFKNSSNYITMINKISNEHQSNPNFLAGIVAQESGFNPKAVSWAKAIGLTQMTTLAEEQVIDEIKSWPRYPGIQDLSYMMLKSKILIGEITDSEEWRLDPELSLLGGMAYVQYLKKYWDKDENKELLSKLTGDIDQIKTQVILASYNSGAARVKKAIKEKKDLWKSHKKLKEAFRYIRKVSSYCYHGASKEVEDDS